MNRARFIRVTKDPCEHKTFIYTLVTRPPFPYFRDITAFQGCAYNELHALVRRHMVDNGEPTDARVQAVRETMAILQQSININTVPLSHRAIVDSKPDPGSRRRYANAFQKVRNVGLGDNERIVNTFVKIEKWDQDTVDLGKAPRAIQFRGYGYCGVLSTFLKPIEDRLWTYKEDGRYVFAKGKDSFAIALSLRQAWDAGFTTWCLLDHSKFDSSIMTKWTNLVREFYLGFWSDLELEVLLKAKLRNKAYTKAGSIYEFDARLCSGDYDTSLVGNLLNFLVLKTICNDLGIKAALLVNGDDSCLGLHPADLQTFIDWFSPEKMREYGFETKLELAHDFQQIEFCQAKPIEIRHNIWRMVRDPIRVLSRTSVSVRKYEGKAWLSILAALGDGELACNSGVPMLQQWAMTLKKLSRGARAFKNEYSYRSTLELNQRHYEEVTDCARHSFAAAFGISPIDQVIFEQWLITNGLSVIRQLPGLSDYYARKKLV